MPSDNSASRRVAVVHWGRSGAGPLFLKGLASALKAATDPLLLLSYNGDAEIAQVISEEFGAEHAVRTYHSKVGVVTNLPRSLWYGLKLRRAIVRAKVEIVVSPMESIHQSLLLPLLLPRRIQYTLIIHDAQPHAGESNFLQRIGRQLELWRADRVVTLSTHSMEIMTEVLRRPGRWGRRAVIAMCPHPAFDPPAPRTPARKLNPAVVPRVGFFGRLSPYKGLARFEQFAKLIFEVDPPCKVVAYGSPSGYDRGSRLPAANHIEWRTEWIPEEEVAEIIASFDVLVLPYDEATQSGVLALAQQCGVPAAVTPVGGLPEQIGFGACGAVAVDMSAEALVKATQELLRDGNRYMSSSLAALENSRRNSWELLATIVVSK